MEIWRAGDAANAPGEPLRIEPALELGDGELLPGLRLGLAYLARGPSGCPTSGHDDFTAMVSGLQSLGKLLQGLQEVIALRLGHPYARFIGAVAQFLFLLQPTAVWIFLVPPTLAISLVLSMPSGRSF